LKTQVRQRLEAKRSKLTAAEAKKARDQVAGELAIMKRQLTESEQLLEAARLSSLKPNTRKPKPYGQEPDSKVIEFPPIAYSWDAVWYERPLGARTGPFIIGVFDPARASIAPTPRLN
jgi:hypothetical protein